MAQPAGPSTGRQRFRPMRRRSAPPHGSTSGSRHLVRGVSADEARFFAVSWLDERVPAAGARGFDHALRLMARPAGRGVSTDEATLPRRLMAQPAGARGSTDGARFRAVLIARRVGPRIGRQRFRPMSRRCAPPHGSTSGGKGFRPMRRRCAPPHGSTSGSRHRARGVSTDGATLRAASWLNQRVPAPGARGFDRWGDAARCLRLDQRSPVPRRRRRSGGRCGRRGRSAAGRGSR